jgi:predicted HTH transcriptional regulator
MIDIEQLLSQNEGKNLEFKQEANSPQKIIQTIVAFANTAGGFIVIGVEDKTKAIFGIANPLTEEERLTNIIKDSITPMILPDIETVTVRNQALIIIQVYPTTALPYYVKSLGPENGVYIRLGASNRRADVSLIEELKRNIRNESYDELPMTSLNSEAIDFQAASEFFHRNKNINIKECETLKLLIKHGNKVVPSIGGILLFGKNRLSHFPDAIIRVARFIQEDKSQLAEMIEFNQYWPEAIEKCFQYILKNIEKSFSFKTLKRKSQLLLPAEAIREVLMNSVLHADYSQVGSSVRISIFSNRIEFENPGNLLKGLTFDDLEAGVSKVRNRVIARVFKELKLIEQWGSGIPRIQNALKLDLLPKMKLEELGGHFRVTLFFKPLKAPKELDKLNSIILSSLKKHPGQNTKQLAAILKISDRATRERLRELEVKDLISAVGTNSRDPKKKYYAK